MHSRLPEISRHFSIFGREVSEICRRFELKRSPAETSTNSLGNRFLREQISSNARALELGGIERLCGSGRCGCVDREAALQGGREQ